MSTLTFLNSALLWGALLASIPLIIHLLFRRQYRRIDWAPMRYLKLSLQRNRRRIRIEQLLLLLMRMAMVVLLFFLVARPVMHAEGLSRWLGTGGRTNRIAVLDDSLSMGYSRDGKTALARGQDVLADLLGTFGAKDGFTLVLASDPRQPVLREVELENLDDVVKIVRGVQASEVLSAWEPVLRAVDELVTSGSYPIYEVTIVTDLRRAGWEEHVTELAAAWAGSHVRVRVFDVGLADTENVALVSLTQADRVALVHAPTRFVAELRNDTSGNLAGLEANFIVDGRASLVRLPEMAPGETIRLPLTATFQEDGQHDVALELPNDALPGDNRRQVVVDVRESMRVLIVDGEPSGEPLGSESDFLALALSLSGDAADPFRVEVLTDSEWASLPMTNPDVLMLAGVARLSEEQVEMVEQRVRDGMGLMIFVGDQIDPDNYNQLLYKNGGGLLPASLVTYLDGEFSGLLVDDAPGSPLEALTELSPAALQRIKVRKIYEIKLPDEQPEGVHVLARWNNQAAAPAVVQKTLGQGNVLLCTTAADRSWSDWPTEASYVLAVREAARAIARTDARFRSYVAGQPLAVSLPASRDISLPEVRVPGDEQATKLVISTPESSSPIAKPAAELRYSDTRRAGIYKMSWRDSVEGPVNQQFAVNPDPRESDLARFEVDEFRELWGALDVEVVSLGSSGDSSLAVHGKEIWRTLASCLFGLLVFEACFARWAGRQR